MQPTGSRPATDRRHRGGFSLVEVIISAVILVILVYMVVSLTMSGTAAQKYAERVNRVTEITQDLVDDMRSELTSSVRVFHDDALGNAYLGLLDMSGARPAIAFRLPALDANGIFEQEAVGETKSGNALLFARHSWTATYATTSANEYQVDVYRLVHYYLAPEEGGPQPGRATGLNLCKWVSEPLVDGDQVDKISDSTDRTEVLRAIYDGDPDTAGISHPEAEVVWLRGDDPSVTGTLRSITSTGNLSNSPQSPRTSPWQLLRDIPLSEDSLLYYRHHSVATNYALGNRVGRFSQVLTTGDGFPHGFEIQVIGPSAGRQVLVHLSIATTNSNGTKAHCDLRTTAFVQDI